MNDTEYRSYFQQRLSNYQSDKVPEFDQLFAGEDLLLLSAKSSGPRLWPLVVSLASVAAAAALLLLLHPLAKDANDQVHAHYQNSLSLPDISTLEINSKIKAYDEPVLLATSLLSTEIKEYAMRGFEIADEPVPVSAVYTAVEEVSNESAQESAKETNEIEQDQLATNKDRTKDMIPHKVYERSVQEAHSLAAEKSKRSIHSNKPRLSVALNQNNGLLASVSPGNYQSMMASVANNYQDAYSVLNTGSLMRSGTVSPNAWQQPGNLDLPVLEKPTYHFPLNLSLAVSIPLFNRVELHTGLSYSYLTATTQGATDQADFTLFQELHYLGLPLKISYRIMDVGRFGMYSSLGGSLEKGLIGKQKNTLVGLDNRKDVWTGSQRVHGVQPIALAQLGFDYTLISKLQLYFEPGVVYYFDTDQPLSIRTRSPLFFNFGLGLCYRL